MSTSPKCPCFANKIISKNTHTHVFTLFKESQTGCETKPEPPGCVLTAQATIATDGRSDLVMIKQSSWIGAWACSDYIIWPIFFSYHFLNWFQSELFLCWQSAVQSGVTSEWPGYFWVTSELCHSHVKYPHPARAGTVLGAPRLALHHPGTQFQSGLMERSAVL